MNFLRTSIKYILLLSIFVLNGCSLTLLNFSTANKDLHLSLVNQSVFFEKDSAIIRKVTLMNGKETSNTVLARFPTDSIDAYDSFLADLLSGSNHFVFNETYPYYSQTDHFSYGSRIRINSDTSKCLLTMSDASALDHTQRTLFLLDMKLLKVRRISTFNVDCSYIEEKEPFQPTYNRMYDVECEAKWLNESEFLLATDKGLYLYSISDLSNPGKLTSESTYPSFIPYGDSIIYQTRDGVYTLDLNSLKIGQISTETETYLLKLSGHYLFFSKGWTLYRVNLQSPESVTPFNTGNLVKDFYLLDTSTVMIINGNLATIREQNSFYLYDLSTGTEELFDEITGKLINYYLTDDNKYFVVIKQTVYGKKYRIFVVYDILSKKRYDFDFNSL